MEKIRIAARNSSQPFRQLRGCILERTAPERAAQNPCLVRRPGLCWLQGDLPMQSGKNPSLYERLGGVDAVANITDDLVERITVDPLLKPYFSIDRPRPSLTHAGSRYLLTEMICS